MLKIAFLKIYLKNIFKMILKISIFKNNYDINEINQMIKGMLKNLILTVDSCFQGKRYKHR
jgi:hypothetical protein